MFGLSDFFLVGVLAKMKRQKKEAQDSRTYPFGQLIFPIPKEKKTYDDLVAMVDKMLKLQKKYHSTRLEHYKKLYNTQIDLLDNQIDSLVYKLYGLTKEEIRVVERG